MDKTMLVLILSFASTIFLSQVQSVLITFQNNCPYIVWPAIQNDAKSRPLSETGLALPEGSSSYTISAPRGWSGRFWARTGCTTDARARFACSSGDCGTYLLECHGNRGAPPATFVEITLNGAGGKDFYDISLVDGFNLPVSMVPQGGSGSCASAKCVADLNKRCPPELQAKDAKGRVVGCKSACLAFDTDEYCCRGAFGSGPDACKPSKYAQMFKSACPQAYSYGYDNTSSTFTCSGASEYLITFCPGNYFGLIGRY